MATSMSTSCAHPLPDTRLVWQRGEIVCVECMRCGADRDATDAEITTGHARPWPLPSPIREVAR